MQNRHRNILRSGLILAGGLFFSAVQADFRYYRASLQEARWLVSGDRLQCELSHTIPGYGQLRFQQKATRPVMLVVQSEAPRYAAGLAELGFRLPEWKHYAQGYRLGTVPLLSGRDIISLPEDWSRQVVAGLQQGLYVEIAYHEVDSQAVTVSVNAVPQDFHRAWEEFQQCQQGLLQYRFDDVKQLVFYFDKSDKSLKIKEKDRLMKMAEYARLESRFKGIDIDSYTDSRGNRSRNKEVARVRAERIRDFLVRQGVPAKKIHIRAHGEKNPQHDNRTEQGRKMNRRVEISMHREE